MNRNDSSTWKKDCHCSNNDSDKREELENACSLVQDLRSGFEQNLNQSSKTLSGPTRGHAACPSYGHRRSESAPHALLDCLHCGKDLEVKGRSHTRRSTVASDRCLTAVHKSVTSPRPRTSRFPEKQKGEDSGIKYDRSICGLRCQCCGRSHEDEYAEAQRRWQSGDSKSLWGKSAPYQFKKDDKRQNSATARKTAREKNLEDDHLALEPLAHAGTESCTLDLHQSFNDNRTTPKYACEEYEHARACGDVTAEDELADVNENQRRQSLTCCSEHHHSQSRRETLTDKRKRRSYPGSTSCRHISPSSRPDDSGLRRRSYLPLSTPRSYQVPCRKDAEHSDKTRDKQRPTVSKDEMNSDRNSENVPEVKMLDSSHSLLMTNLTNMWRRHRLCDVILRSNGQEIAAHKLALAAFSDTFARQYCEGGNKEMQAVLDIPDTSVGGIQEVLRYVYTGDIRITSDNVAHILAAASFLHLDPIVQMCREMLLCPDVETVIFFSFLVEKYKISDNLAFFYDFMCKHFLRVSRTRGWRILSFGQVFDLLSEDNLNVERELDVFHAAVLWIDWDRTKRLTFAADLIGCVRFAYITPDEIAKHVETKDFLFHGDEGKELLLCIYRHHALQTCGCQHGDRGHRLPRRKYVAQCLDRSERNKCNSAAFSSSSCLSFSSARRQSKGSGQPLLCSDAILCIGGVNPFKPEVELQARLVEQFNPRDNCWTILTRLPDGRHHHGVAVLGGAIYVIGGSVVDDLNPGQLCNPTTSCYRYDIASGQWSAIAPLNTPRMYHATVVLNEVIFVICGQAQQSRHLASMECYRPEVDEWEAGVRMSEGRIGMAVAGYRGQLYAVGGFLETEQEHVVRGTVEVFDPIDLSWSPRNPLPVPLCHAGLVQCGDKLYLVGGSTFPLDSPTVCSLASLLRYHEVEDRWDRIQMLRTPRHDMGVAVLGSRIFVVGGVSSTKNKVLKNVECYDVESDCWLDDVEPIGSPALGLVCVTLLAGPNSLSNT